MNAPIFDDYDADHLGVPCASPLLASPQPLVLLLEECRQLTYELGCAKRCAALARRSETRAKWSAEAARLRVARETVRARIARQESNR